MEKILLIGAGLSARTFSKILKDLKYEVGVFQHRKVLGKIPGTFPVYNLRRQGFEAVIIASDTSTHIFYVTKLLEFNIPIFVEKPFSDKLAAINQLIKIANERRLKLACGFNLRYLPAVLKIKDYLNQNKLGKILFASLYVGQYLPDWRRADYGKFYSASHAQGGGVALDLIHEVDLALWWFPKVGLKTFKSEKLSNLKIDCEDFVQFKSDGSPKVEVTLDYLNHIKSRRYIIVGDRGSIECDVINQTFKYHSVSGKPEVLTDKKLFDVDLTYKTELEKFLKYLNNFKKADERSLGIDALRISLSARKHVQG